MNRDLRQFQSDTGEKDQLNAMDVDLASDTVLQLLEEKIFEIFVAGQVGREHEKRAAADQQKDNQGDDKRDFGPLLLPGSIKPGG